MPKAFFYGTENISSIGPKIWGIILIKFKELNSLILFKKESKNDNSKIVFADYARHTSRVSKFRNLLGYLCSYKTNYFFVFNFK